MYTTALPAETELDNVLRTVLPRLVAALHPERIILFGSHAEGHATADSDVDLLVITARPVSHSQRLARTRGLFRDVRMPVQVLTLSRQQFERTRDIIGGIAYPAGRYGRIVYERA